MFYSKRMFFGMHGSSKVGWVGAMAAVLCVAVAACSDRSPPTAVPGDVSSATPTERPDGEEHEREVVRGPIALDVDKVAEGFQAPLDVVNAGDGSNDLFVVEQGGQIWRLSHGEVAHEPFLSISGEIVSGGEQGLLGLAFHPDYENNGLFYVDYTDTSGDTVIAEFKANGRVADPGSERRLLKIDQPYSNHNGGNVVFGPDGYLYIGMGDGGAGGDPEQRAQNHQELLGKMLRLDVDSRSVDNAYGVPEDNPFADDPDARPEIWDLGLRNPWRFSFDRETGDLWIGDVGQDATEEVDHAAAGEGGINWGWDTMEGAQCYEPATGCDQGGLTGPVTQYGHDAGCTVTGGFVYRGSRQPRLLGRYIFGDYCTGLLWTIPATTNELRRPLPAGETGLSISSFGESEDGEIYLTDLSGGGLYRVVAR